MTDARSAHYRIKHVSVRIGVCLIDLPLRYLVDGKVKLSLKGALEISVLFYCHQQLNNFLCWGRVSTGYTSIVLLRRCRSL